MKKSYDPKHPPLTKRLLMSLPTGTYLSSNMGAGVYVDPATGEKRLGPSWTGVVAESRKARLEQWEDMKTCEVVGRLISITAPAENADTLPIFFRLTRLPHGSFAAVERELSKRKTQAKRL